MTVYTPQKLADSKLLVGEPHVNTIRKLMRNGFLRACNLSSGKAARWVISHEEVDRYNQARLAK